MKNIANFLDEYDVEVDEGFKHHKPKTKIDMVDYIKANRKASREEEIAAHGHPIPHNHVFKNKKAYDRKRDKKINY